MQKRKRITTALLAGLMALGMVFSPAAAIAEDTITTPPPTGGVYSDSETGSGDEAAPAESTPETEPENKGGTDVTEGENAGENEGNLPETGPETDENQPETDENQPETDETEPDLGQKAPESVSAESNLRRAAARAITAGEGEKLFTFEIDSSKTGPQNINDSGVGLGVDGPGASAAYSGHGWNEAGYELITVVDETTAPEEGISLDALDNPNVLKFYVHDSKDYDGGNTDRQRIELKGHNKSSQDILGSEGDIITYNWKFYLPADLVETPPPGFFHVFQIKAIDNPEAGAPIFTFTVTGEELLFRNVRIGADMSTIEVIDRMPIQSALGRWLEADVTIQYRDNGYVSMSLTDAGTGEALMSGSGPYDCWRRPEYKLSDGSWAEGSQDAPATQRTRPKWGLYRSIGRPDSGTVVSDATMYFGDLNIIKRNPETYIFDDGYDPKEAGDIPNRKPDTLTWTDELIWNDENPPVKASVSNGSGLMNLFNSTSWRTDKNIAKNADKRQVWIAVDLGEERPINQISLSFNGGGDRNRLKKLVMAYTTNQEAFDELQPGNNGTPYPFQTSNGDAWTTFLDTKGIPQTSANYSVETFTARYIILVADAFSTAEGADGKEVKIKGWQLRYEESPAKPLNIVVTSPVSGDDVGSGAFVISGEISNILSFEKLGPVEVLNQNKEVVASAAAVQSQEDPTKAVYSVQVPAPAAAGEYKYTVSVSEPDKVEGSRRVDRAAVTVSAQGIVADVDNNYTESDGSSYTDDTAESNPVTVVRIINGRKETGSQEVEIPEENPPLAANPSTGAL